MVMVWRFNTNLEQMVMAKVEAELKSWVSISVQEQKQSNQSRELTQLPAESVTESVRASRVKTAAWLPMEICIIALAKLCESVDGGRHSVVVLDTG